MRTPAPIRLRLREQDATNAGLGSPVALAVDRLEIEILASIVVIWQLTDTDGQRERTAMRIIRAAFFALAVYIAAQGLYVLATGGPPAPSPLGIAWTAITCAAMLALAFGKARTGAALGNPVLTTEGRVTLIDAYLAAAVLLGLLLNAGLSLWWADPLAGFVIGLLWHQRRLGGASSLDAPDSCLFKG